MHKRSFLGLVVLLTLAVFTACSPQYECTDAWGCATFDEGDTVKVGYVGPTTGDYSQFGIDISRGTELALQKNPDVEGWDIEVVIEDTQGTPEQGAAVANKLSADAQIVGVVGHTFSGSTEVAIPIYDDAGVVMVSPSATNPTLVDIGSGVFNRVCFTDKMQAEFAAKYIYEELGIDNLATMHDGGAYGKGLADLTAEMFESLGGTVVGSEAITPGETDYSAPLAAIDSLNPGLIYYGGYAADAAVLVNQMPAAGLDGVMFFGCDGTYGEDYLDLTGDEVAEGTFSTFVPIPESEAFDEFKQNYEEQFGDPQGKLSPFSPHGHDSMMLILSALDEVAITSGNQLIVPRQELADTVRNTDGFEGLTGTLSCDANGDCAAAAIRFMMVENGEWVDGPGQ